MKVYTANITVSGSHHSEQYGRKNTPNSFTRVQRKFPHTKYSSRQLIYTKATRIFLQHQILILYTALFGKGQCGSCWCHWKESLVPRCTESLIRYFTRQDRRACILWQEIVMTVASQCSAGNGLCLIGPHTPRRRMRSAMLPITQFPENIIQ